MTAMFNLWNPFAEDSSKLSFDLTAANMPQLKDGSQEFMDICLKKMQVDAVSTAWEIHEFRSAYYSDYLDSNDWEDVWTKCWAVTITADLPGTGISKLSGVPIAINAFDSSWRPGEDEPQTACSPLILSIVEGSLVDAQRTCDIFRGLRDNNTDRTVSPEVTLREHSSKLFEIRAPFKPVSLPEWAEHGKSLMKACRAAGGIVNFRDLPLK